MVKGMCAFLTFLHVPFSDSLQIYHRLADIFQVSATSYAQLPEPSHFSQLFASFNLHLSLVALHFFNLHLS